jgi:hypothetical protein
MNFQFNLQCGSQENVEKDYKEIINKHSLYILNLEKELVEYKNFHDAILNNNAIGEKIDFLNNEIKKLEKENNELKKELKKE